MGMDGQIKSKFWQPSEEHLLYLIVFTLSVTLTTKHIKLQLCQNVEAPQAIDAFDDASNSPEHPRVTTVTIPWTSPVPAALKGIIHVPAHNTPMKPSRREALLIAIAKAADGFHWRNGHRAVCKISPRK